MTSPRTLIVSPQKTGTHLIQELMLELGYRIVGATRPSEHNIPQFTVEQRKQIAALVYRPEECTEICEDTGSEDFIERTDAAWTALCWSWYRRFGQPVISRYGQERLDFADAVSTNPRINSTRFDQTPEGLCWIWHDLDMSKVDGNFIGEWCDTGEPPVILNYRDPRDALVSLINFVEGKTAKGFGNFYERKIFNAILPTKATMPEKIDYALRDPYFPGRSEFEKSLWLLNHPGVCKVRYEDLAGPQGGGDSTLQVQAVERVLKHVGATQYDAEGIASRIYNTDSWSFHKGRIGKWREAFSEENTRLFQEIYGDILEQYGYE
ncbi:hypothetical protein OIU91_10325 [Streptomyces sp. NBC_01456]|uniref:hypothetical protein n=1 Tax=unclassified Streptomyces TaxID=2593676 RepID=UPI002E30E040|nr:MULTISPECIES: hypothetical protein [unclassified Streptomyces]